MPGGIDLLDGALGVAVQLLVGALAIRVKTFERDSSTFLVDVCSCLRAKDLRGVLGNSCWEKRLWLQRHPRLRRGGGKLPTKARHVRGNSLILVNNVVADC